MFIQVILPVPSPARAQAVAGSADVAGVGGVRGVLGAEGNTNARGGVTDATELGGRDKARYLSGRSVGWGGRGRKQSGRVRDHVRGQGNVT